MSNPNLSNKRTGKRIRPPRKLTGTLEASIFYRSHPVIVPSFSDNNDILPILNNFSVASINFKALIDSGASVNIINSNEFNKLPVYIK
jgi:hypothetical protein